MTPLTNKHEHPNITTQEQLDNLKRELTHDLRRLHYYSKLRQLDYEDSRFHKHLGQPYYLPRAIYVHLDTLKECLFERGFLNIIICERTYLYERLKLDGSKPYRDLKDLLDRLEDRLCIRWMEVDKTTIKIVLNPLYGYVYSKSPRQRDWLDDTTTSDQQTSFYTAFYSSIENYYRSIWHGQKCPSTS